MNRKVYLSISGQAHQGDVDIITNQLDNAGLEVIKHIPGEQYDASKMNQTKFMVVLPTPYNYGGRKNMWIIGKGQYNEISNSEGDVYVKDIKRGTYHYIDDVSMIDSKDWTKYGLVELDHVIDISINNMLNENYSSSEKMSLGPGKKKHPYVGDKLYPKSHTQPKQASAYTDKVISVLGRPRRKRFIDR